MKKKSLGIESVEVNIILDSINTLGQRLTTFHVRYPRMVHSELMTHRVFSRNGRSSRAVPVMTIADEIPYLPLMKYNKSGMQPAEYLSKPDQKVAQDIWMEMYDFVRAKCLELSKIGDTGVHKQWANRPLEAFGYIDVLITSTDFNNFFALRLDEDAQDEIRILAVKMKEALNASTPSKITDGDWHLPYITEEDHEAVKEYQRSLRATSETRINQSDFFYWNTLCKISAARCARISYRPFSGKGDVESELARYSKLAGSFPVHASPLEHQGMADAACSSISHHGNFRGFVQFRKLIPNEVVPG